MKSKIIHMKSHVINLLDMAMPEVGNPGFSIGAQIAKSYLVKIADRAIELNDPLLLAYCDLLCLLINVTKEEEAMFEEALNKKDKEKESETC